MNVQTRDELALVRERIRRFENECSGLEYTDTGDAWELLFAARDAIDQVLTARDTDKRLYGCDACGCTDIEYQCWVTMNTGQPTDDCGSKDLWCPQCQDAESRCVEVQELKPYDPNAGHGIPDGA